MRSEAVDVPNIIQDACHRALLGRQDDSLSLSVGEDDWEFLDKLKLDDPFPNRIHLVVLSKLPPGSPLAYESPDYESNRVYPNVSRVQYTDLLSLQFQEGQAFWEALVNYQIWLRLRMSW